MGKELLVTIKSVTPLQGTLTIPTYYAEIYPAIMMISDAGKLDRDEMLDVYK
ncbi:hypothetical protein ACRS6Y_11680 [Bacillus cytotoxicus]|uniref:Uncharacterized protein n=1 Tax=Bacillus cytotoxicus TaxID=580165 RepID=A0AAX2CCJ2_9BACI|nr:MULTISPECIES: hypothetical protein [Bacillus cereus group]MDH2860469.1 hypothetical protein [Bacillus cytotoxicus]MDH2864843.1 hypothetical protein [Bacillus cytotoxicus]MDH2868131.1 hypothetical protein [Bacillus cytotoxicus]MDH2872695.1 hypothetical protein [Bacillus cytotoxicus]MDH2876687.1 hypothetical protein [Bacillus cytotoxicus]